MIVGIPKEILPGENRVALIPSMVGNLKKAGLEVVVEKGAGAASFIDDQAYEKAGATLADDAKSLYSQADLVLKVRPLAENEAELLKEGSALVTSMDAFFNLDTVAKLRDRKITSFAMEFIPRITRAQSMDMLSSMAGTAGYRAVLAAAFELPKYFPLLMTAAGTVKPARVFVVGAGVAGLMAIATAKRLGAVVEAYDVRSVVKEQVESLGAKFVEFRLDTRQAQDEGGYAKEQSDEFLQKQREMMKAKVAECDVVITTAAIPGRQSPILVTEEMVEAMKPGSVIVDLAAERGGNVVGTVKNEKIIKNGVKIIGYIDHASRMSTDASSMYSKNITTYVLNMIKEGQLTLDMEDEIVSSTVVTRDGEVVNERVKAQMEQA